jgi:hypothetical protein
MFIIFQGGAILKLSMFFESSKRARIKNKSEYNQFITNCQINIVYSQKHCSCFGPQLPTRGRRGLALWTAVANGEQKGIVDHGWGALSNHDVPAGLQDRSWAGGGMLLSCLRRAGETSPDLFVLASQKAS